MKIRGFVKLILLLLLAIGIAGCASDETKINSQEVLSRPKTYVGSGECKFCHLEHYDSWKNTLHSRTIMDVTENRDALIAEINSDDIRKDLKAIEKELKVPLDEIYIPKVEEIKYTIGMQWKQGFLIEKDGTLYVAPVQYNAKSEQWVHYHENDWGQRPWNQ